VWCSIVFKLSSLDWHIAQSKARTHRAYEYGVRSNYVCTDMDVGPSGVFAVNLLTTGQAQNDHGRREPSGSQQLAGELEI
jgi:hypothetical protein